MKKILLAVLTVLTMVCIFTFVASAYEHEYFSIDVPSDFIVSETSDGAQFTNSEGVFILINVKENDYTDFYNMSEADRTLWDDKIKGVYSAEGVINEYESSFNGDGISASAMGYSFTLTNPDDASDYIYIEGVVYSDSGILYNTILMYDEDADYDEIEEIVSSLNFTPEGSESSSDNSDTAPMGGIHYISDDGVFSLTVPEGFAATDAPDPLDAMWMPTDGGDYAISTFVTDNILHEALANLDAAGIEKIKNDVVSGAGNGLTDAKAEQVTVSGKEGVHIYGNYASDTGATTMEIYMFSTYDKLYAVYFYDFGDDNAEAYMRETINSINITGDILVAEDSAETTTQVTTVPYTEPLTQPTVPTAPAEVITTVPTEAATTAAVETEKEENDKAEKDNTTLYIVIGAVVAIVLIAVVAIVIVSQNRKKAVPQYAQPYNPQQYPNNYPQNPPMNNYSSNGGFNQDNNKF